MCIRLFPFLFFLVVVTMSAMLAQAADNPHMDEFIKNTPYPCPDKKTEQEAATCLLDATIAYMEKGEKEESAQVDNFDGLVGMVARHGSAAQKEKLLSEYELHRKSDQYHPAPSGNVVLLLALNRLDDAVKAVQDLSSAETEPDMADYPQVHGLLFLAATGKFDEALVFFKKTQNIKFPLAKKHVEISGFARPSYPPSQLIGALLVADKWNEAQQLRGSIDPEGIYYRLLKADNYQLYYSIYEGYKNAKDKKAFAHEYWGNNYDLFARKAAPGPDGRQRKKQKILAMLSSGTTKEAEKEFNAWKKGCPHKGFLGPVCGPAPSIDRGLVSDVTASIQDIKNSKGQDFLWSLFIRTRWPGDPQAHPTYLALANAMIFEFRSAPLLNDDYPAFDRNNFLTEKLKADLRKQARDK